MNYNEKLFWYIIRNEKRVFQLILEKVREINNASSIIGSIGGIDSANGIDRYYYIGNRRNIEDICELEWFLQNDDPRRLKLLFDKLNQGKYIRCTNESIKDLFAKTHFIGDDQLIEILVLLFKLEYNSSYNKFNQQLKLINDNSNQSSNQSQPQPKLQQSEQEQEQIQIKFQPQHPDLYNYEYEEEEELGDNSSLKSLEDSLQQLGLKDSLDSIKPVSNISNNDNSNNNINNNNNNFDESINNSNRKFKLLKIIKKQIKSPLLIDYSIKYNRDKALVYLFKNFHLPIFPSTLESIIENKNPKLLESIIEATEYNGLIVGDDTKRIAIKLASSNEMYRDEMLELLFNYPDLYNIEEENFTTEKELNPYFSTLSNISKNSGGYNYDDDDDDDNDGGTLFQGQEDGYQKVVNIGSDCDSENGYNDNIGGDGISENGYQKVGSSNSSHSSNNKQQDSSNYNGYNLEKFKKLVKIEFKDYLLIKSIELKNKLLDLNLVNRSKISIFSDLIQTLSGCSIKELELFIKIIFKLCYQTKENKIPESIQYQINQIFHHENSSNGSGNYKEEKINEIKKKLKLIIIKVTNSSQLYYNYLLEYDEPIEEFIDDCIVYRYAFQYFSVNALQYLINRKYIVQPDLQLKCDFNRDAIINNQERALKFINLYRSSNNSGDIRGSCDTSGNQQLVYYKKWDKLLFKVSMCSTLEFYLSATAYIHSSEKLPSYNSNWLENNEKRFIEVNDTATINWLFSNRYGNSILKKIISKIQSTDQYNSSDLSNLYYFNFKFQSIEISNTFFIRLKDYLNSGSNNNSNNFNSSGGNNSLGNSSNSNQLNKSSNGLNLSSSRIFNLFSSSSSSSLSNSSSGSGTNSNNLSSSNNSINTLASSISSFTSSISLSLSSSSNSLNTLSSTNHSALASSSSLSSFNNNSNNNNNNISPYNSLNNNFKSFVYWFVFYKSLSECNIDNLKFLNNTVSLKFYNSNHFNQIQNEVSLSSMFLNQPIYNIKLLFSYLNSIQFKFFNNQQFILFTNSLFESIKQLKINQKNKKQQNQHQSPCSSNNSYLDLLKLEINYSTTTLQKSAFNQLIYYLFEFNLPIVQMIWLNLKNSTFSGIIDYELFNSEWKDQASNHKFYIFNTYRQIYYIDGVDSEQLVLMIKFWVLEFKESNNILSGKNNLLILTILNYLFRKLLQIKNVNLDTVKPVYQLLKYNQVPIYHEIFHVFYFLKLKSPLLTNYIMSKRNVINIFGFNSHEQLQKSQRSFITNEFYTGKEFTQASIYNISNLLDSIQFTWDYIIENSSFDQLFFKLNYQLTFEPLARGDIKLSNSYYNDSIEEDLIYLLKINHFNLFFIHLDNCLNNRLLKSNSSNVNNQWYGGGGDNNNSNSFKYTDKLLNSIMVQLDFNRFIKFLVLNNILVVNQENQNHYTINSQLNSNQLNLIQQLSNISLSIENNQILKYIFNNFIQYINLSDLNWLVLFSNNDFRKVEYFILGFRIEYQQYHNQQQQQTFKENQNLDNSNSNQFNSICNNSIEYHSKILKIFIESQSLFEESFINGNISLCDLLVENLQFAQYEITREILIKVVDLKNINIIYYYFKNGRIQEDGQLDFLKDYLLNHYNFKFLNLN